MRKAKAKVCAFFLLEKHNDDAPRVRGEAAPPTQIVNAGLRHN
jgi:hypothetical protein